MSEIEVAQRPEAPAIGIKRPRGGKRPGAGRKPNLAKRLGTHKPMEAAEILALHDVAAKWDYLLNNPDPSVVADALKYLTDRVFGRPRQAVDVSGGIIHAHTAYRDPRLARLSQEALQALYEHELRKIALPASDAAQDGQHNQIESKPALEA
jgi:hypothetical protein